MDVLEAVPALPIRAMQLEVVEERWLVVVQQLQAVEEDPLSVKMAILSQHSTISTTSTQ